MGRYGYGYGMPGPLARRAWSPLQLGSSLALWLRADLGITLNGATVSAWADQSGNGRHATQGTAGLQPTFVAADSNLGGRPSLDFGGAHWIRTAALSIAQPVTWLIVARADATGAGAQRNVVDGYSTVGRHAVGHLGSNKVFAFASLAGTSTYDWPSTSRAVVWKVDGVTSGLYTDGNLSPAAQNYGASAVDGVRIGSGSSGANFWDGSVAEVVLVTSVSAEIRTALTRYAGSRYGITVA